MQILIPNKKKNYHSLIDVIDITLICNDSRRLKDNRELFPFIKLLCIPVEFYW